MLNKVQLETIIVYYIDSDILILDPNQVFLLILICQLQLNLGYRC